MSWGHHVSGWQGKAVAIANHARMGQLRHVELVARLVAHIGQRELQGEVEGMDVGTTSGHAVHPFLDIPPVGSPILADDERLLAVVQGQALHPTADEVRLQAAHEVEAETVEADSPLQPLAPVAEPLLHLLAVGVEVVAEELGPGAQHIVGEVGQRVTVRRRMEMPVVPFIVRLALARMLREEKMCPRISRVVLPLDVALRVRLMKSCPDIRRDSGIGLEVLIATIEMIQHHVGINLDARLVHRANHLLQLGPAAIARLHRTLLVVVAQVVVVVDAVAAIYDAPVALGGNGCPQAADASGLQFGSHLAQMIPPRAVLGLFVHGHVPIERLHHHVAQRLRRLLLLCSASRQ